MRLRDIGEAAVWSTAGSAVAVRAAVLVTEGTAGPVWGGQLWPYRPLALTPGRYTLRVRGQDLGALTVESVRSEGQREVADFVGEGPPSELLQELAAAGGGARPGREPRFPRVAGEVEPTGLSKALTALVATLWRMLTAPRRAVARRR